MTPRVKHGGGAASQPTQGSAECVRAVHSSGTRHTEYLHKHKTLSKILIRPVTSTPLLNTPLTKYLPPISTKTECHVKSFAYYAHKYKIFSNTGKILAWIKTGLMHGSLHFGKVFTLFRVNAYR